MNYYTRAIAFASAALLLSLVALVLLLANAKDTPATQPQAIPIVELPVSDIAAVAINNPHGAYGFILAQDGNIQLLAQPEIAHADYALDAMQAFVFQLSKLTASRAIASPGDLRQYGLDSPQARITIVRKDASKLRLLLGHASPVGDAYYLRKEEGTAVYLIGKRNAEQMLRAQLDYWNRQLLPRIDAQSIDQLDSIELASPGQTATSWRIAHVGNGSFRMTQPVSVPLRADIVFAQLLRGLSELHADRFVALAKPADPLTPAQPPQRLEITFNQQRHTLLFTPDGHGGFLVRSKDGGAVLGLARENAAFLSIPYRDLVGDYVYNTSLAAVQSVAFMREAGGDGIQLTVQGAGAEMVGISQGRSIPAAQLSQAMAPLFAIGIVAEVAHTPQARAQVQAALAQPPTARVVIHKRDGTQDQIAFFPLDAKRSFVRFNGATDFISYTSAADAIEQSLMALRGTGTKTALPGN